MTMFMGGPATSPATIIDMSRIICIYNNNSLIWYYQYETCMGIDIITVLLLIILLINNNSINIIIIIIIEY